MKRKRCMLNGAMLFLAILFWDCTGKAYYEHSPYKHIFEEEEVFLGNDVSSPFCDFSIDYTYLNEDNDSVAMLINRKIQQEFLGEEYATITPEMAVDSFKNVHLADYSQEIGILYQNEKKEFGMLLNNLKNNIKIIVLPMDGIDEFAYIKHTSLNLEKIISANKIEKIYTGKVNKILNRICQLSNIKLISFYDDIDYIYGEDVLKTDVVKTFLEEKTSIKYCDLNVLVLNNNTNIIQNLLGKKIYNMIKSKDESIDAVINFSKDNLEEFKDKIIIEMNEMTDIDLSIILNCKKIYFINQLLSQYLTKSGGKLLYDSMVNR